MIILFLIISVNEVYPNYPRLDIKWPNLVKGIQLGILGIGLGVGLVFGREYWKNSSENWIFFIDGWKRA